ncbi:Ovarian tumor, otubain [Artemisia annua]|uniref:Ubiquitin thioesterase OTU n=1 Tax=Artemisia annua TaxID=35608 RepID=A0A2U1KRT5_ARTAN|nr:Ovarian tumor, otubain [Artemisia annua]
MQMNFEMAIKEVLCDNDKERHQYCQRIGRADFWGGESELLVLSKLCRQPIMVYIPKHEHTKAGYGSGFIPIAEYGI